MRAPTRLLAAVLFSAILLAGCGTAAAAVSTPTSTAASTPTVLDTPTSTAVVAPSTVPSVAQLCAAPGTDDVDALLAGVTQIQLIADLAPLTALIIPQADHVVLVDTVAIADVRTVLRCDTADPQSMPPTPASSAAFSRSPLPGGVTPPPSAVPPSAAVVPDLTRGVNTGGE